jgi:ABC-type bacteriocin/lantibiotic exporter with double-glycine peptidase domain
VAAFSARRYVAPEVIQTSAMDCGPASLKCLLEGFGIPVSYGRLREACQTDVDGTSIDVLEEVSVRLGLNAEQVMLPLDHLLLRETEALPALLVWRNPDGAPHFVVVWGQLGGFVQVMDPQLGRRWMKPGELLENVYVHTMPISAEVWRRWAESDAFLAGMRRRLAKIGARGDGEALIARCREDESWQSFAALDASLRLVASLVTSGGIDTGQSAGALVASLFETARVEASRPESEDHAVPATFWTARAAPPAEDGAAQVFMTGCVLVKVRGVRSALAGAEAELAGAATPEEPLSPELEAALREPPVRPARELLRMLREDGVLTPVSLVLALIAAAMGGAVEALLLRGLLDIGRQRGPAEQRVGGVVILFTLLGAMLALEMPTTSGMVRMGRRLETRLRVAFLSKIPKLTDRYFHSRPTSDMAHRCHTIHPLRQLPSMGGRLLKGSTDLLVTASGLVWIDPKSWPVVVFAVVISIALPWAAQRAMVERDLRARSFDGSLTRFYLDALLGLFAVRTHGAERAVRSEHSGMLMDWMRAAYDRLGVSIIVDAVEAIVGFALAVWLTFDYLHRTPEPAAVLLLLYWALNVPQLGQEIASSARQYPAIRNLMLRLLEPLGALEEKDDPGPVEALDESTGTFRFSQLTHGAHLAFRGVTVRASGRTILETFDLTIPAGQHVGIVGPSGAGKSSFVGLLLGWHRPAEGTIFVDGGTLRGDRLLRLRTETAWVDPAVQLWNRSMLENLEYGATGESRIGQVLEQADLIGLLERLPDGLQTELGEGGALVSGGEGQRVRLGRAMMRPESRLVILDEPFRGLDRERRRALLKRARELWRDATVLCVTHDVGETQDFERVLVIEEGRIQEDGPPAKLLTKEGGRYRALLKAEEAVRKLWMGRGWRRVTVRAGRVVEEASGRAGGGGEA